jgi:hypothetical protein
MLIHNSGNPCWFPHGNDKDSQSWESHWLVPRVVKPIGYAVVSPHFWQEGEETKKQSNCGEHINQYMLCLLCHTSVEPGVIVTFASVWPCPLWCKENLVCARGVASMARDRHFEIYVNCWPISLVPGSFCYPWKQALAVDLGHWTGKMMQVPCWPLAWNQRPRTYHF